MNDSVYDLGSADREAVSVVSNQPVVATEPRRREGGRQPRSTGFWSQRHAGAMIRPPEPAPHAAGTGRPRRTLDMGATLSLFAPGMGQMVRGRPDLGFLFLISGALLSSLAWAAWTTRAGLAQTLPLLGLSRAWGLRTLLILYGLAAVLHITAVVGGIARHQGARPQAGFLALTSALVPGWGQALAGRAWRTGFCLGGLWLVGFAWLMSSPPLQMAMAEQNLILPPGLGFITKPLVLYTGPAVLWAVAMSDAFHGRDVEA